ncbi:hypothetical protein [Nocardioides sp. Root140]|uniref:hypothetical protein n=1 Tax=Nocardioides sp. Root140 TaxID=1736460 RepID=UPI0006FE129A|nr:hypothetical protein [Nocardioides sp. Root140]KQY62505.1 hypothetical protein ASD30_24410 [Nocardioides sp. Root140]
MGSSSGVAPWLGLAAGLVLVAAAILAPLLTGWEVHSRFSAPEGFPPWQGWLDPRVGPGTLPALVIAALVVTRGASLAQRLPFARLAVATFLASLAWLVSLATIDGTSGISGVLGEPNEYLETARSVHDVPVFLGEFVDRVPLDAADNWPVHVSGHPPGMTLFFVFLARIGLGGDLAAGLVVTVLAATIVPAVLVTLRALDADEVGRRAAPYLVLTPAALLLAVSADAVMAAVAAWGLAALALAASRSLWWSVPSGLLLGSLVLLSYGLGLFGCLALAVLFTARSWRPLLPTALVALAVPLSLAPFGYWWPEGFTVLRERYWDGVASLRPASYWLWADLALVVATVGPWATAGLARLRDLPRAPLALVVGALAAMVVADLSLMSKAEVERIWLPFMPWLTLAVVALPKRWRGPALVGQACWTLLLAHLVNTGW